MLWNCKGLIYKIKWKWGEDNEKNLCVGWWFGSNKGMIVKKIMDWKRVGKESKG